MKSFIKVLCWVLALIVLALFSWILVLYLGTSLWMVPVFFFSGIGCYFLIRYLRRLFILKRSRSRLVQQIGKSNTRLLPQIQLRQKWQQAIALLRRSHLNRHGNALEMLPWFMVVGRSGTGKTTALTRARVASPIKKIDQDAHITQTVDYDWWYFDKAVVIDCAGRYVDTQDNDTEWELGLDLLARYRPRAGLDGLVLAISSERLLHAEKDALIEEGRAVRIRIEQLIQLFGKRFPIYILITKCDQLYGLEEWAAQLPAEVLEQAMGYLSAENAPAHAELDFVEQAFDRIGEHLRKLRMILLARCKEVKPELLLFPNELAQLKPALSTFIQACLAENPYQESPFLRGLFFSSALQQGGAVSTLLGHVLPAVPVHAHLHRGLFLHDFFDRVLPADRYIGLPVVHHNRWRQSTRRIGLLAAVSLLLALIVAMSLSFYMNISSISLLQERYPFSAVYTGQLDHDILNLERANTALMLVEQRKLRWKIGSIFIPTNSETLQSTLTQNYVRHFRENLLPALDARTSNTLAPRLANLVFENNLLQARLHGANRTALEALSKNMVMLDGMSLLDQRLHALMLSYLAWTPSNDENLLLRFRTEQTILEKLAYVDPQLTWLTQLVVENGVQTPVTSNIFWGAELPTDSVAQVPAAFTDAGKQAIDRFLAVMENSVQDKAKFLAYRTAFERWYQAQRIFLWQKFMIYFSSMESPLIGETEWRIRLDMMASGESPYYRVIDRVVSEFADYPDTVLPNWLLLARRFHFLRMEAQRASATNQTLQVIGAMNAVGKKAVKETLSGSPQRANSTIKNHIAAVSALQAYFAELKKLTQESAGSSSAAYRIAADLHQSAQTSAVRTALTRLDQLKTFMTEDDVSDEAVWRLIAGPLHFVVTYVEQQASCEVQKNWQENVLWSPKMAVDKAASNEQLYGAQGSLWTFLDGVAKPFLTRDENRFQVTETFGYKLPFNSNFLPLINSTVSQRMTQLSAQQHLKEQQQSKEVKMQQNQLQAQQVLSQLDQNLAAAKQKVAAVEKVTIPLMIKTQPTSVNADAKEKPFATILTIQCASGTKVISNYNFPVQGGFSWTPGQCGEVSLQIKLDNLVLVKKYPAGVVDFLRDFPNGTREFQPDEFPAEKNQLTMLGVHQIGVRYEFDRADDILQAAQEIDAYAALEKQTQLEKQGLQDQQRADEQEKIALQAQPNIFLLNQQLPQQIGMCWNQHGKVPDSGVGHLVAHTSL